MQRTVLELVQDILVETGSDEINSIEDTIEAGDIATIMRQVYEEMVDELSLPSTSTIRGLVGLGDPQLPNVMQMHDDANAVKWIKYDARVAVGANPNYADVCYKTPAEFVAMTSNAPSLDTVNYQVVFLDPNVPLTINKKKAPSYWTSFDDNFIVFDSYNSSTDSTLQSSKSIYESETRPVFYIEDDFTPELPDNLKNVLYTQTLNRVLATDNKVNPIMQRQESRMRVRTSRNKWRQGRQAYNNLDYGRKR